MLVERCRRILLEGVKDHIVSSLHSKATPFLMWKALTELFQSKSDQKKLALKDKLREIKMEKNDTIPVYLTKFFHCRDELGNVGFSVDEEGQVNKVGIRAKNLYKLEVDGISTELPTVGKCEKAMQLKL